MRRIEAKTAILEGQPKKIDLSFLGEHLGAVTTGTDLVWDFFCRTHGLDSTVAALPHDIEIDPKKLGEWIDVNINPPKCSVLCRKRPLEVSLFYPLDIEPRRIHKKLDLELEFPE